MRTIRLILTFARSSTVVNLAITAICLGLLNGAEENWGYMVQLLFLFKILTMAGSVYIVNYYKKHEFYYYKNLGVSKLTLWIPILSVDFLLFLTSFIYLALKLHEAYPRS